MVAAAFAFKPLRSFTTPLLVASFDSHFGHAGASNKAMAAEKIKKL
jgi:hypothetical protein